MPQNIRPLIREISLELLAESRQAAQLAQLTGNAAFVRNTGTYSAAEYAEAHRLAAACLMTHIDEMMQHATTSKESI